MSRILIVDDDAALVDVLTLAFEDAGYLVGSAADGVAALTMHRLAPFDAIVCDVNMPALDGFAFCKTLRDAHDATPLVMLTSRDGEIDEALELGADDYVSKPFSTRVLLARVAAILRRDERRASAEVERPLVRGRLELRAERLG